MREQLYLETQTLQNYAITDFPQEVSNLTNYEAVNFTYAFWLPAGYCQ